MAASNAPQLSLILGMAVSHHDSLCQLHVMMQYRQLVWNIFGKGFMLEVLNRIQRFSKVLWRNDFTARSKFLSLLGLHQLIL